MHSTTSTTTSPLFSILVLFLALLSLFATTTTAAPLPFESTRAARAPAPGLLSANPGLRYAVAYDDEPTGLTHLKRAFDLVSLPVFQVMMKRAPVASPSPLPQPQPQPEGSGIAPIGISLIDVDA